jgi:hypothetical protein
MRALLVSAAFVASAAIVAGQAASILPPVLFASPFEQPPDLDGVVNDSAWRASRLLTVTAGGVTPETRAFSSQIALRAGYTNSHIYLAVTWTDDTRDDQGHRTWIWDGSQGRYVEGPDREDMLGVAFEHTGPLVANMLAGFESSWDVWHWMAFRTNPQGYAADRMHHFTNARPTGRSEKYTADDGSNTWIARPDDAGSPVVVERPAPATFAGEQVPRYVAGPPEGSAADVRAKGAWADCKWTVEFSRRLDTGHADDTRLSPTRAYRMAVSVHNRTSGMDRASGVIVLRFRGRTTRP